MNIDGDVTGYVRPRYAFEFVASTLWLTYRTPGLNVYLRRFCSAGLRKLVSLFQDNIECKDSANEGEDGFRLLSF